MGADSVALHAFPVLPCHMDQYHCKQQPLSERLCSVVVPDSCRFCSVALFVFISVAGLDADCAGQPDGPRTQAVMGSEAL